jgi:hypothetical protein
MKRLASILLCAVSLMAVAPAQAHGWHGGWHGGGYGRGWVAPVLGAAIVGGAIYAATAPTYVYPAQSYVVAPPVTAAPPRVAYFCPTSQQFYPAVPACNVPWQVTNY